jgi:xanthine dehydrogenase YagR molybdenum-binding subunit
MTMGVGLALTEGRIMDRKQTGRMVNRNWLDYRLPTSMEVPFDHTTEAIDTDDKECNNTGAKGLGEPAMIPAAAAVANAIYDAVGVRVPNSPVPPPEMLRLLAEKDRG